MKSFYLSENIFEANCTKISVASHTSVIFPCPPIASLQLGGSNNMSNFPNAGCRRVENTVQIYDLREKSWWDRETAPRLRDGLSQGCSGLTTPQHWHTYTCCSLDLSLNGEILQDMGQERDEIQSTFWLGIEY